MDRATEPLNNSKRPDGDKVLGGKLHAGIRDRLIRVLVPDQHDSSFHPSSFPESEIQSVDGLGEDRSALVLRSGVVIPVALPYEELEQKIYSPDIRTDSSVLDLRHATGNAAKPEVPANIRTAAVPGDKMMDGAIYAGISPDTGEPMYATPADAPLTMTFNDAVSYAKKLDAHGHRDWRLPSKAELKVLFNNRAAIGGFNVSGSSPAGWYRSGTQVNKWFAWGQRFSDGCQLDYLKDVHSSVRCVR